MAHTLESVEAQERLDALRRGLYRSGAGEEDLRRYAEVRDALLHVEHAEAETPDAPPVRRRRRLPIAAIATAAALAIGVGVGVMATPVRPHVVITPTAQPSPAPTGRPLDIGDGRTLVQDAAVVSAPVSLSVSTDGSVAKAQQFEGTGDAVVPLDVGSAGVTGGRGMLMLSSSKPSLVDWRALSLTTRRDWSSYEDVLAQGTVLAGSSPASPVLFDYPDAPPTSIAIQAAHDLHWTLVVVFLGTSGSAEH